MRRVLTTLLIAALGMTVVGTGIALAGEVAVTPETPSEGASALTLEITEFAPDTPIYAVPCDIPEGDELDPSTDDCDLDELAATTTDAAGNATIVVTWDIPSEGMAVYIGDEARTNQAWQVVTPGTEDVEAEGDEPDVEVLGTSVVQEDVPDDLADTGPTEVLLLVMVATAIIGLGLALHDVERRHTAA